MTEKIAYSAVELERLAPISRTHIYRMMDTGEIPVVQLGTRRMIPSWWVNQNFFDVQNLKGTSDEDELQPCA